MCIAGKQLWPEEWAGKAVQQEVWGRVGGGCVLASTLQMWLFATRVRFCDPTRLGGAWQGRAALQAAFLLRPAAGQDCGPAPTRISAFLPPSQHRAAWGWLCSAAASIRPLLLLSRGAPAPPTPCPAPLPALQAPAACWSISDTCVVCFFLSRNRLNSNHLPQRIRSYP